MNLLKDIDEKLFLLLNGTHTVWGDYIMSMVSNLFFCIPIFLLIALTAKKYFSEHNVDHPQANALLLIFVLLFEFLLCRFLLPDFFGQVFQMERPCLNPNISSMVRMVGVECTDQDHFARRPCVMFFITTFLLFTIRKDFPILKLLLIIWSVLVAYSRIYLGAHYPVNVLIAIAIGVFLGYFGSRFYFYLKNSFFAL